MGPALVNVPRADRENSEVGAAVLPLLGVVRVSDLLRRAQSTGQVDAATLTLTLTVSELHIGTFQYWINVSCLSRTASLHTVTATPHSSFSWGCPPSALLIAR